jgi:xanthine/uracil permease
MLRSKRGGAAWNCRRHSARRGNRIDAFRKVATAHWIDIVWPFHFGVSEFHPIPIIMMCIVMVVVMIESLGIFLALGEVTGKSIDQASLTRGLRADGIGTILGAYSTPFHTPRSPRMLVL